MPYRILLFLFDPICFKDSQHLYWIDASKTKSEVTGSIWKPCVFYAILQFTRNEPLTSADYIEMIH